MVRLQPSRSTQTSCSLEIYLSHLELPGFEVGGSGLRMAVPVAGLEPRGFDADRLRSARMATSRTARLITMPPEPFCMGDIGDHVVHEGLLLDLKVPTLVVLGDRDP